MEATDLFRTLGVPNLGEYHQFPICTAGAYNLEKEAKDVGKRTAESGLSVIDRERDCPEWTRWMMGSSPKEHREMLLAQEARDFQTALVERLEDLRARRENRGLVVTLIITGGVLGLFTLLGPTLAVWVENSLLNGG